MIIKDKNYKLELKQMEEDLALIVELVGVPGLGKVRKMMGEIEKLTSTIEGEYVSITDFSKLKIGRFLESLMIYGMESVYNRILSVSNKSKYSFVIVPESQKKSSVLKKSLERINEKGNDKVKYNYVFVSNYDEIREFLKSNQ